MFNSILNQYDPKDSRSHGILTFFVDALNERELIDFVDAIFAKNSWILPTEISRIAESIQLKEKTALKFYHIFNQWVEDRLEFSSRISSKAKDPLITIDLILEFREILLSLKNLDFTSDIMAVLKLFLENSNSAYFVNFLKSSLSLIIVEYEVKELERFFMYFISNESSELSINYLNFIYIYLDKLSVSYKIHDLSNEFLEQLSQLSLRLETISSDSNYSMLISIFLIDLIREKKLDLSNSRFNYLIGEMLKKIKINNSKNIEFFRFLRKFNYSFPDYNFKLEVENLLSIHSTNISILNGCSERYKKEILSHYLKSANGYFEFLLFFLEQLAQEDSKEIFIKFQILVEELRESFNSLLWYKEFLNFEKIDGNLYAYNQKSKGFEVKIDEKYFKSKIKSKELSISDSGFMSHYGYGFMLGSSVSAYKAKLLAEIFINERTDLSLASDEEFKSFFILKINYSDLYKGKSIQLVPESNSINKLISKYRLKALFPAVEIFLVEKAHEYLKLNSPFLNKGNPFKILSTPDFIYNYKIPFSEDNFWDILKTISPSLYETIFVTRKNYEESLAKISEAYTNDMPVSGLIKSRTNGGMIVEVFGVEVFLPGSQIDVKPVRDFDKYLGKVFDFKIVNEPQYENIVISRRALLDNDTEILKSRITSSLYRGQILEGYVKNITSFGVFVDLGGLDGLIHITDLTWNRINHPCEVVELDDKLKVIVLDFDEEKTRIQLGFKQLLPHPWDDLDCSLKVGDRVFGKVVVITDYGAFVELISGVEALIHISEMSWSSHIKRTEDIVQLNDIVEAVILTFDRKERKMSLSLKLVDNDPWECKISKYVKGSHHIGRITNFTNFGVFVELEAGIEGLIYISDLTFIKQVKHPTQFVKLDQLIKVIILDSDIVSRKLSLGHKQIMSESLLNFEDDYAIGKLQKGTVIKLLEAGAVISLQREVYSLVPYKQLKDDKGNLLNLGDEGNFIITNYKRHQQVISLSRRDLSNNLDISADFLDVNQIDTLYESLSSEKKSKPINNENIHIGQRLWGEIVDVFDYGAFLRFSNGIDSLIKVSEMSWNSSLSYAQDYLKIGDSVEAVVIDIDNYTGEILSSIKQLTKDPWIEVVTEYQVGSIHSGRIFKLTNFGMIVSLKNDVNGFLYFADLPLSYKNAIPKNFENVGDELEVAIVELDSANRKIFLTLLSI